MQKMRELLAQKYTPEWVARKSDAQVYAIFTRLVNQGVIKA